ncbi:aldo-keto reductase family 1 member B7-like [Elgaria multicarinata webbii]|uniref:aldo-keto reductase family 1 member B7-like n=1 Tax=Elgaria multicarinata webbii TaxID=159646 RepID=UPI002FCD018D
MGERGKLYVSLSHPGALQSPPGIVQEAIAVAVKNGYRLIDCAFFYDNEGAIGEGLQKVLKEGCVKREELFIISKLWNSFHAPEDVKTALLETLRLLQLDYLDLYLMHSPMGIKNVKGNLLPQKDGKVLMCDVDYVDTWKQSCWCIVEFGVPVQGKIDSCSTALSSCAVPDSPFLSTLRGVCPGKRIRPANCFSACGASLFLQAMEKLVDDGLVRGIGMANFNQSQVERLLSVARVKPDVLQVERHVYQTQCQLIPFTRSKGMALIGYSPLTSPKRPFPPGKLDPKNAMEDPLVKEIAKKHGKSPAQVLIRFNLQSDIATIPKSQTPAHIIENSKVFDFRLTDEEMKKLESLHCGARAVAWDILGMGCHKFYPFSKDQ